MAIDDFLPEPEPASDASPDSRRKHPTACSQSLRLIHPWGTRIAIAGALALVATVVLRDRVAAFDDVGVQLAVG